MSDFYTYDSFKKLKNVNDELCKEIIKTIGNKKEDYYRLNNKRTEQTNLIKCLLSKLGLKKGYKVYTRVKESFESQNENFINHEWLYDVHWYNDKEECHYTPNEVKLVAES